MGIEYSPETKRRMNKARMGQGKSFTRGGPVTVRSRTGEILRVEEPKLSSETGSFKYKTKTILTCRDCDAEGFVWLRWHGRWRLAKPHPGTLDPNPMTIHRCPAKGRERQFKRTRMRTRRRR